MAEAMTSPSYFLVIGLSWLGALTCHFLTRANSSSCRAKDGELTEDWEPWSVIKKFSKMSVVLFSKPGTWWTAVDSGSPWHVTQAVLKSGFPTCMVFAKPGIKASANLANVHLSTRNQCFINDVADAVYKEEPVRNWTDVFFVFVWAGVFCASLGTMYNSFPGVENNAGVSCLEVFLLGFQLTFGIKGMTVGISVLLRFRMSLLFSCCFFWQGPSDCRHKTLGIPRKGFSQPGWRWP